MDAIVLAGGYATRLWPITRNRPKMFLPVGERAVIDHTFEELERDDRINDVYVSTNERFADAFAEHIAESDFEKPRLSVEETTDEDEKFGVVGALAQLVEREGLSDDTLVVAGDNLISFDLAEFVDFFEAKGAPTLAAYDVGSVDRASSYGVVELEGDRVVALEEKPDEPPSTLVSIACYCFPAETLPLLSEYLSDGNNPDEPGWFVSWLVDGEPVYAFTFDEAWYDIGTPESYLEAVSWYLDGENYVHPDATTEGAELTGNVHVMAGATIENARVTRSVVFEDAVVGDGEIRDTLIDRETKIRGVDLSGAVIGAHTKLDASRGD